jgi:1-acyl-sn-glycerol-3-phosphate acyltransferase
VNSLRGVWRLLRVLLHVVQGLLILALLFPRRDAVGRQWHIQRWSAGLLRALGLRLTVRQQGTVPRAALIVANHVSWLDIACVHAALPQARFVSKADVRAWPLIGWMVAAAGTLFIERERKRDALRVVHHCAEALKAGDTVAVFPEGTTGEGPTLLPFHANLLQSAVSVDAPLLPLALRYHQPGERFAKAAAYVGEMNLIHSLWRIVSAPKLAADLTILDAIDTQALDRRVLADLARERIQAGLGH